MIISHQRNKPVADPEDGQAGYILPMVGLLMIPLLLMVGLSVDVGSWYNRASQVQKAADAAALAGVVWLPRIEVAEEHAIEAAARNGYVAGDNVEVSVEQVGDRQLRVSIEEQNVSSFFWANLGGRSIDVTRSATAQYVLPVKMGSPLNSLGNDPTAPGYPSGAPNLWASINGYQALYENGDPFSTVQGGNPEYRDWGYLYVIDVPQSAANRTLTVELYDAGQYPRADYPNVSTADNGSMNTSYELFRPDLTPLDAHDGLTPEFSMAGRCSTGPGRVRLATNAQSSTYRDRWATLCRITNAQPGQWIMQVKSSNIPGMSDSGSGWNQFSVRASLTGTTQPALYTVGDLSLFNNLPGRSGNIDANFYLAEVIEDHAGKTLEISLFDPGDGQSGDYFLNIRGPNNSPQSCRYRVRGDASWTTSSNCRIQTRTTSPPRGQPNSRYNGLWLDLQVSVPNDYECVDCWWTVLYEFRNVTRGASPNDRTVWAARVIGDPVHLVEDD